MLILLSSSRRKRYRDDILRCLAAPKNTYVQFRYSKEIVEPSIWERPNKYEGERGLVCNVDLSIVGRTCPILPVRSVITKSIARHGSTMSLILQMGDLSFTDNTDTFTTEIGIRSGKQLPFNDEPHEDSKASSGRFLFSIEGEVGNLTRETTLANWENITGMLFRQPGYEEEQFFWTVLGLYRGSSESLRNTDEFKEWNMSVDLNKDYTLLVYVYHPLRERWKPSLSYLSLASSMELSTSYPLDVTVDSPYDLKKWWFQLKPSGTSVFSARGWIKLGPVSQPRTSVGNGRGTETSRPEKGDRLIRYPDWEIDLPLRTVFSWSRFLLSTGLLGILISVPAITSIFMQQAPSFAEKTLASLVSLVAGLAAATIARLGIKRIV